MDVSWYAYHSRETAADDAQLNTDKAITDTPTQYLTTRPYTLRMGYITHVQAFIDSANNTTFHLYIYEDNLADDKNLEARMLFKSDEHTSGAARIADATFTQFTNQSRWFYLQDAGRLYYNTDHSAAAGNCLGELRFSGKGIV